LFIVPDTGSASSPLQVHPLVYDNRETTRLNRAGDPAAGVISTRPIEKEVGSDVILAKVLGWLHECLHGEIRGKKLHKHCPSPMDDYLPTRLIEITKVGDNFKLKVKATSGSATEPYCALSYCWGGEQHIKSTKASLSTWMESIPWDNLPQTLRDAVTVCQKLNVKYLWVDAFCIVQDDQEDKTIEIAQMPNVYYNSTLTIAASRASNVREGFLEERSERQFMPEVFTLKYHANRAKKPGSITLIRAQITPEPLDTRGWTLQERLLSARTLEFGSRQIRFICQHNPRGATDGWRLKPEHNKFRQDNLENTEVLQASYDMKSKNPAVNVYYDVMETWYRLVAVYSHRNLTLPEDRILAISGIAERYGRFLNDSYLTGLWRSTLSRSLYWKVTDNTRPRSDVWQGPSWSWVSLSSPVEFPIASSLDMVEPQVVAVDIDLQNTAHPYGAIIEGSGRLVVKGRRLTAVLLFSPEGFGGTSTSATSLKMNETGGLFLIRISVDSLEEARKAADEGGIELLELSSLCTDERWWTRGLVVWRYGEDSFTRLGTFEYQTDDTDSRKEDESVDDWRLRASREFNWFGIVRTGIYDIL
jgi:hypothetical protein